jgi:general secretion pathway protein A
MYERFYNLRERPFRLSPDPDYVYPSRIHSEALRQLRNGIEGGAGFVVITGEIGSGKTTLLQTVLRGIDGRRTAVARLVTTRLDDSELIEAVMLEFGLEPPPGRSKPHLLHDLARFLVELRRSGRLALLMIDEAQNLAPAALEEIRMLSNLETEKSKLIQIVLVGQPGLREMLNQPELEQLRQRVTVRYHMRALDLAETAEYINHRLRKAAMGTPLVFPPDVTDLIGRASGGLPRKINVISDAVLLFGYGDDKPTVDAELVIEVVGELEATGVLASQTRPAGEQSREAIIAHRERQLAEQHRIVSEQYRLLRLRASQLAAAAPTTQAGTAPVRAPEPAKPSAGARNPSLWARLRQGFIAVDHASSRHQPTVVYFDEDAG